MVPLGIIKRKRIMEKLRRAGAVSEKTAVGLEEAGVAKGDREYPGLVSMMLREKTIARAGEKFYLTI